MISFFIGIVNVDDILPGKKKKRLENEWIKQKKTKSNTPFEKRTVIHVFSHAYTQLSVIFNLFFKIFVNYNIIDWLLFW
jgi:hypothetical protein